MFNQGKTMNIDSLTIGEAKQLAAMFSAQGSQKAPATGLSTMIGAKCIVRTQSAGVWYGTVIEKDGNEVIIKDARRMWRWWAKKSISLSAVSLHGIKHDKSQIAQAVPSVWLEAIELIPVSGEAAKSIEGAPNAEAN